MCVRCGTGLVTWCTHPTRHDEEIFPESRVLTKRDLIIALLSHGDLDEPVLISDKNNYRFLQEVKENQGPVWIPAHAILVAGAEAQIP